MGVISFFTYRVFFFLSFFFGLISFLFFFLLVGLRVEAHIRTQPQNIVLKAQTNFATQDTRPSSTIFYIYNYIDILTNFVGGATTAKPGQRPTMDKSIRGRDYAATTDVSAS